MINNNEEYHHFLAALKMFDVTESDFKSESFLADLKKKYHAQMLATHPDKAGKDAPQENCKNLNASKDILIELHKKYKEHTFNPDQHSFQPQQPTTENTGFTGRHYSPQPSTLQQFSERIQQISTEINQTLYNGKFEELKASMASPLEATTVRYQFKIFIGDDSILNEIYTADLKKICSVTKNPDYLTCHFQNGQVEFAGNEDFAKKFSRKMKKLYVTKIVDHAKEKYMKYYSKSEILLQSGCNNDALENALNDLNQFHHNPYLENQNQTVTALTQDLKTLLDTIQKAIDTMQRLSEESQFKKRVQTLSDEIVRVIYNGTSLASDRLLPAQIIPDTDIFKFKILFKMIDDLDDEIHQLLIAAYKTTLKNQHIVFHDDQTDVTINTEKSEFGILRNKHTIVIFLEEVTHHYVQLICEKAKNIINDFSRVLEANTPHTNKKGNLLAALSSLRLFSESANISNRTNIELTREIRTLLKQARDARNEYASSIEFMPPMFSATPTLTNKNGSQFFKKIDENNKTPGEQEALDELYNNMYRELNTPKLPATYYTNCLNDMASLLFELCVVQDPKMPSKKDTSRVAALLTIPHLEATHIEQIITILSPNGNSSFTYF